MKKLYFFLFVLLPFDLLAQDTGKVPIGGTSNKTSEQGSSEFSPFRLWLGTNLDLLDGIGTSNLYANLDFTTPLFNFNVNDKPKQVLFSIGLYQNRSNTVDSTNFRNSPYVEDRLLNANQPPIDGLVPFVRTSYRSKPSLTTTNLGVYAVVGYLILAQGDSYSVTDMAQEIKTVNIYGAVRSQIVRRQYLIQHNLEEVGRDTLRALVNENDGIMLQRRLPIDQSRDTFTSLIEIGVPFIIVTDKIEVNFNPYIGRAFEGDSSWTVGSFGFNITEKKLGLSVGAEIRSLKKWEAPLVNVFVAKSLTMKDLRDIVTFN